MINKSWTYNLCLAAKQHMLSQFNYNHFINTSLLLSSPCSAPPKEPKGEKEHPASLAPQLKGPCFAPYPSLPQRGGCVLTPCSFGRTQRGRGGAGEASRIFYRGNFKWKLLPAFTACTFTLCYKYEYIYIIRLILIKES